MELTDFFPPKSIIRNKSVKLTHFTNRLIDGIVCFATDEGSISQANKNKHVKAVITFPKYINLVHNGKGLVISNNPKKDYFLLHNYMFENGYLKNIEKGHIDKTASIASTAIIENNVIIEKNVVIGDYTIIRNQSIISKNTHIGSHCIIGARGLNNTKIEGHFLHVHDAGGVKIGENCEILDHSIIQKSTYREMTTIGNDTRISVKTNIGHGVYIGERSIIAGNVQIAGYTSIGDDVWIGPSATVSHGLNIGSNAEIKLGSVVIKDVKEGDVVSGNFAMSHNRTLKNFLKAQR